jgi:hypothetical protein
MSTEPVILDLVVIGLAIALDPLPLAAYFILLPSRRGVLKGGAFVGGWLVSMGIVVAVTIAATGNRPPKPQTAPSTAALVAKIVIGAGLIAIAIRQRRRVGRPKKPKRPPKWQAGVDDMSLWFAAGLAPLLQPWGLIAAGAATVVNAEVSSVASGLALVWFCVLATSSYIALELYAGFRPQQTEVLLARLRTTIEEHTDQIIIYGCLVLGLWLVGQSIYLIVS